jgi:hypothetical protein
VRVTVRPGETTQVNLNNFNAMGSNLAAPQLNP